MPYLKWVINVVKLANWLKGRNCANDGIEKNIATLQQQLNESKEKIRKIRAEMELLIYQGTEADDLDRKILSLDYENKKRVLEVEEEHFNDLNRAIAQLQDVALVAIREKALENVTKYGESIDTEAMNKKADRVSARREVMHEETENMHAIIEEAKPKDGLMEENEEYSKLVSEAKRAKIKASLTANGLPVELPATLKISEV